MVIFNTSSVASVNPQERASLTKVDRKRLIENDLDDESDLEGDTVSAESVAFILFTFPS